MGLQQFRHENEQIIIVAEDYTALCLERGPLTPTRMDQGRRGCRLPPSLPSYSVRLHQSAEAGRTATKAARDHLRVYGKPSQTADAGGIIKQ